MYIDSTQTFTFAQIVGESSVMREMLKLARRVAESEVSGILLQGESGTGKDCVAKAIHHASRRAHQPFVAINCAALPSNLIESELFGHEKGAFTDAKSRKQGLLEQADGGTILLDEISELDINLQAKLLRVLEDGTFRRVGGLRDERFSARVIAASNRDLKRECESGHFRIDLYYRLAVIQIDIAPLSQRGDDVLLLANHFLALLGDRPSRPNIRGMSPEVARFVKLYNWPGNVRELHNVIERAFLLEESDLISVRCLPDEFLPDRGSKISPIPQMNLADSSIILRLPPDGISLEDLEISLLKQALGQSNGNQTRAASLLGLTRDQFRYRWKKVREASRPRLVAVAGSQN
jgi:two-component system, NtrC family, response regulator AtoC